MDNLNNSFNLNLNSNNKYNIENNNNEDFLYFDKMRNYKNYFVHNNANKILIKPLRAKLIMRCRYKG